MPLRLLSLVLIVFLFTQTHAQDHQVFLPKDFSDRILNFNSDITVQTNGKLLVSESITIYNGHGENTPGFDRASFAFNDDIQRGIVRDFPTKYKDSAGFWSQTGFKITGIYKNGSPENYTTDKLTNGVRIKIGNADILLDTGVYHYRIDYETDRQLIFHDNKDELYWNVNGNGWVFTVDTISCTIHFPTGAIINESACYTGAQGSTASKCRWQKIADNIISFSATEKLNSYDGLTVAAAIQKGILIAPSTFDNILAFLKANYIIPLLSLLLVFLFTYYFIVWSRKGRDPRRGVIYPQFSPPAGLTPADVGYIMEQEYGSHLFTAALIDCAVKKQLEIEVTREGLIIKSNVYTFKKPADSAASTKNDYGFDLQGLYGEKAQRGKYNSTLRSAYLKLYDSLKERFLMRRGKNNKWSTLFALNRGYVTFGLIIFIAAVFFSFQYLVTHPSIKLLIISAVFLCAILLVHIIFSRIMSAYTKKGREIADHLLGFKMYLEQAEKHIYNQLTPPEKTLDLFEKYLPFAIALKVENEWASKFDDIINKALADGYRPAYYSMHGGTMHNFSMNDLSRGVSSGLSNTISSASTPPSSSRGGSSGGGSSGGGGGGGGGGGW